MLQVGDEHVEIGEPKGERLLGQLEITVHAEQILELNGGERGRRAVISFLSYMFHRVLDGVTEQLPTFRQFLAMGIGRALLDVFLVVIDDSFQILKNQSCRM